MPPVDSEVPLLLRLREAVTRVRRSMPMDRDVQEICYALKCVIDLQPKKHKRKIEKFAAAWKFGEMREYKRRKMAEYRASARKAQPPRPRGRPRKQPLQPEALP